MKDYLISFDSDLGPGQQTVQVLPDLTDERLPDLQKQLSKDLRRPNLVITDYQEVGKETTQAELDYQRLKSQRYDLGA